MTIGLNYGAWNGNIYTSYLAAVATPPAARGWDWCTGRV